MFTYLKGVEHAGAELRESFQALDRGKRAWVLRE